MNACCLGCVLFFFMGQCGAPGGDAGPGSKNACAGCKTPEAPVKGVLSGCTLLNVLACLLAFVCGLCVDFEASQEHRGALHTAVRM